jgi:hypothetical protein
MNTAASITSISIFGSGGALGAYAQNTLCLILAFSLALVIVIAPLVVQFLNIRFIINTSGAESEDFKHYCKAMGAGGKSPP